MTMFIHPSALHEPTQPPSQVFWAAYLPSAVQTLASDSSQYYAQPSNAHDSIVLLYLGSVHHSDRTYVSSHWTWENNSPISKKSCTFDVHNVGDLSGRSGGGWCAGMLHRCATLTATGEGWSLCLRGVRHWYLIWIWMVYIIWWWTKIIEWCWTTGEKGWVGIGYVRCCTMW